MKISGIKGFSALLVGVALSLAGALAPLPAKASTVTDFVTFSDSYFYSTDGTVVSPFATATGSFDVTFDPSGSGTPTVTNLSLSVIDPNLGGKLSFNAVDTAIVSFPFGDVSSAGGTTSLNGGSDITIIVSLLGSGSDVWYSQTGLDYTMTSSGTDTVTPVSATPLPSTWTIMLIGLAVLGFFAYRRQKANPVLTAA